MRAPQVGPLPPVARRRVLPACSMLLGGVLAALLPCAGQPTSAQEPAPPPGEKRIALVIGNADYDVGRLRNPVNDTRAVAEALRRTGFRVIARENADRRQTYVAINEFGDRLREAKGVALFYFSGHGLQVAGRNFIVPLGARITSERMVDAEAVDVNRVLAEMDAAQSRVNIVILDACRDNPYARAFRSLTRGLAQIDAPRGTLIAYATAPGKVAEDGTGPNSPYTAALVEHMGAPGLPIENVFKRVRIEVLETTGNRQEPWEASSLTGDFMFVPPVGVASGSGSGQFPAAPPVTAVAPATPAEPERRERAQQGALAFSVRIEGVAIWVGERRVGEGQPGRALVVEDLPVGTYRVRAEKAGYKPWEREARVVATQRAHVSIDLELLPTAVTAASQLVGSWAGSWRNDRGTRGGLDVTISLSGDEVVVEGWLTSDGGGGRPYSTRGKLAPDGQLVLTGELRGSLWREVYVVKTKLGKTVLEGQFSVDGGEYGITGWRELIRQ